MRRTSCAPRCSSGGLVGRGRARPKRSRPVSVEITSRACSMKAYRRGTRFRNEQFDERGSVQIEDHPRSSPTISAKDFSPGLSRTLDWGRRGLPLPARIQGWLRTSSTACLSPSSARSRGRGALTRATGLPREVTPHLRRLAPGAGTRTNGPSTRGWKHPSRSPRIAGAGQCSHVGLVEATLPDPNPSPAHRATAALARSNGLRRSVASRLHARPRRAFRTGPCGRRPRTRDRGRMPGPRGLAW